MVQNQLRELAAKIEQLQTQLSQEIKRRELSENVVKYVADELQHIRVSEMLKEAYQQWQSLKQSEPIEPTKAEEGEEDSNDILWLKALEFVQEEFGFAPVNKQMVVETITLLSNQYSITKKIQNEIDEDDRDDISLHFNKFEH